MPMAVFLPCFFSRLYKARYLLPLLALIIMGVEVLQLALHRGVLDVDDFIMNFTGGLFAFALIHIPMIKRLMQRLYFIS